MVKKTLSSFEFDSDIQVIGIAYHLPDYRLSFSINKQFGFNLKKLPDLPVSLTKNKLPLSFSLYFYNNSDLQNSYYLISNENGKLIPNFPKINYFLLITDNVDIKHIVQMIKNLRSMPNIITAVTIDIASINNFEHILHDLEFHLSNIFKLEKNKFSF